MRPRLPADRRRGQPFEQQRQPEPVVRRPDHCEVRRLLHADLAVSRLQRREPGLAAAAHERHGDRWLRPAATDFDGYFGPLPAAQNNCRYDVVRPRSTGAPAPTSPWNIPDNFTVHANGVNLPRTSWTAGGVFTYRSTGGALTPAGANPGATTSGSRSTGTTTTTPHPEWPYQPQRPQVRRQPLRVPRRPGRPSGVRGDDHHGRSRGTAGKDGAAIRPFSAVRRSRASRPAARERQQAGGIRPSTSIPDGRDPRCSSRDLHDPAPRRPAGEPDAPLRSEPRAGPGVHRLPIRLSALVRQEWLGQPLVELDDEDMPAARPVLLVRRHGHPVRRELAAELLAMRPDGAGPLDRPDRGRHRRRHHELHQHQQQLVPAVRVRLRRQLRREAEPAGPGRPRLAVPDGNNTPRESPAASPTSGS